MSKLTEALDSIESMTKDRSTVFGMKRVERTVDEARTKFNEAMIKIRVDRVEHRRGRGKNLWTHCGVTRPIEQRCSCGEGADD